MGIKIAFELEGITRIGIDFESVHQINMQLEAEFEGNDPFTPEPAAAAGVGSVDEDDGYESIYKPGMGDLEPELDDLLKLDELIEGHNATDTWKNLKYLTQGLERISKSNRNRQPIKGTEHEKQYIDYLNKTHDDDGSSDGEYNGQTSYLEFLKENRIELNTIMTQIGAKRFWNWLYSQIIKTFPTRQYYGRVIRVPPYKITLPIIDELNKILDEQIKDCIHDEALVISKELLRVKGFLNTRVKKLQIHERLTDIVGEDENLTKFSEKLDRLIKSSFNVDDVDNNN